ncbi:MAG TPA: hypothetical protein VF177_14740 [Anaerolineae bacterium]
MQPTSKHPLIHVVPLLHGNLQYAEFPPDAVPDIVERSYLPALEYFAAHPEMHAVLEYSGVSLELMAAHWPRTIDLLRLLLARGQIELLGSTFANPILPLIPTDHARRHVARFGDIYDQLFGDLDVAPPTGFFLQEFAYDPGLVSLLRDFGYTYTILTPRLLLSGLRPRLNVALKSLGQRRPSLTYDADKLLRPVTLRGAKDSRIAAFPLYRELIGLMFDYAYGRKPFVEIADLLYEVAAKAAASDPTPALLLLGPSDAEFIGVYDQLGREALTIAAFADFLAQLRELPFVRFNLPGRYLDVYPPDGTVYVPAGSSERFLDLWTRDPDNLRLNALCDEAAQKLRLATALRPGDQMLLQQAWRALLLAENSDGRGWMPCPERRLECYNHALRAIELAETILNTPALDHNGHVPALPTRVVNSQQLAVSSEQ